MKSSPVSMEMDQARNSKTFRSALYRRKTSSIVITDSPTLPVRIHPNHGIASPNSPNDKLRRRQHPWIPYCCCSKSSRIHASLFCRKHARYLHWGTKLYRRFRTAIFVLVMIFFALSYYWNCKSWYPNNSARKEKYGWKYNSNRSHIQREKRQEDLSSLIYLPRFPTTASSQHNFTPFEYNEWDLGFTTMTPDYGSLKLSFLQSTTTSFKSFIRQIKADPERSYGHVWEEDEYDRLEYDDAYYAFDDDHIRNTLFKEYNGHCRRTAFHKYYHPNCNTFHEIPMQMGKLLGEGSYREAYLLKERYDPELIVKINRFHDNPFREDRYEFIRMDALVMERLTASPRIVDIYGHCATSVNTEFLPDEFDPLVIPGKGDGRNLNDTIDVDPQNDFTITQKLDYALQMAESIADIHGFRDGVLVHDDIQTLQFLFAPDGRLKLNDFNRAEAMLYDEQAGEYCRYQNGPGGGDYRAPEEYVDGWLNEKIDVFSYGNNIYGLITGLWNFYELKGQVKKKIAKIKAGELPYIDPRYRNRNYIQDRLIFVMEQCWKFAPDDRADIFWVVKYLRETKEEAMNMGFYDEKYVHLHFQDWPIASSIH